MEVSTLRDRRLIALLATVAIVGSGVAAAVVGLESHPGYRSPVASEGALAPWLAEPPSTHDPEPPAPVVVAVVTEDPPAHPFAGTGVATAAGPLLIADPCADATKGRGPKPHDCPKPPKPEPDGTVEEADVERGVVAASEPGAPDANGAPSPSGEHGKSANAPGHTK